MFAMQNLSIAYYFKYYIGKEESVQLFNVIGTVALIVVIPASKLMISVFPGILYMSCPILLYFYTIDHKTCITMQKDLEARR